MIKKTDLQKQLEKAIIRISKIPKWKKVMIERTRLMEIEIGFIEKK